MDKVELANWQTIKDKMEENYVVSRNRRPHRRKLSFSN